MDRFYSKVNRNGPGGCHLWTGATNPNGYGMFRYKGKKQGAHRVSLLLAGVDIPPRMLACHRCDVRACVNPDHLFVGSHTDNLLDALRKGRNQPVKNQQPGPVTGRPTQELIDLVNRLGSVKAAARALGVDDWCIGRHLNRLGVNPRRGMTGKRPTKVT